MKQFLCVLGAAGLLLAASAPVSAADSKKTPPAEEEETQPAAGEEKASEEKKKKKKDEKDFADVVEGFERVEGLFTFYRDRTEGKTYMAIEPGQLDRIFLCSITRSAGDGYYFDSGAMLGEFPFVLRRVGKQIHFVHKNVYFRADEQSAIRRAVDRGLSDSIMGSAKIESAPHPDSGALLVDPSGFFVHDVQGVSHIFQEFIKEASFSFDREHSYFGAIKSFPENSELDVWLHFKSPKPAPAPTLPDPRSFQHVYHYSLSTLPDTGFRPRLADDRVGHFLTMHQDYTSVLSDTPYVRYVNRWQLEKAEPRFGKSKPKQPIVFWLENTIPVEYRDAVREGILAWNPAFEAIGFEDAIEVRQQPDDADWDPADVRYSTVRWIVQPGGGYAVGPSRTNPFSGQIYDADVRISADMIRYIFQEFEEMAEPAARGDHYAAELGLLGAPIDRLCDFQSQAARSAAFGWSLVSTRAASLGRPVDLEKYIHDFIVHVVAHEIGHTLGFRHNFKASTLHQNAEVQTAGAAAIGLTGSVMDYTPVNIARAGESQGAYYQTVVGPYDHWAVEYAYTQIDADSVESEKAVLEKIARKVAEKELAYGSDEDAFFGPRGIDPTTNRWDIGSDPIAYHAGRVELAQELWGSLEANFEKPGARYQKLRRAFGQGLSEYFLAAMNVPKYVGGIYHSRDHVGDPGGRLPFEPVPAARQRQALDFLTTEILGPDAFVIPPSLYDKLAPERFYDFSFSIFNQERIDYPIHDVVLSIQSRPLDHLYSGTLMRRMLDLELRAADGDDPLRLVEMFDRVRDAVWAEVAAGEDVSSFRRALQREHLDRLIALVVKPDPSVPEDASTLARADLKRLAVAIGERDAARLDAYTEAHLDETAARIEAALAAGIERQLG